MNIGFSRCCIIKQIIKPLISNELSRYRLSPRSNEYDKDAYVLVRSFVNLGLIYSPWIIALLSNHASSTI